MKDFENLDDVIKHYGVKGMRWGVRRSEKQLSKGKAPSTKELHTKLRSIETRMEKTKDPKKLKSLQKQYGKIEDALDYAKPKAKKRQNDNKEPGLFKQQITSAKRISELRKEAIDVARSRKEMSTSDMNKLANRMRTEQDFARLRRNKIIATKEDRKDYRLRGNLSDNELNIRVGKLRAKEALLKTAFSVDKDLQKLGEGISKEAKKQAKKKQGQN